MIPTVEDIRQACVRSAKQNSVYYRPLLRHALLRLYHARMEALLGGAWSPCAVPVGFIDQNTTVNVVSPVLTDGKWFDFPSVVRVAKDLVGGLGFKNGRWTKSRSAAFARTAGRHFHGRTSYLYFGPPHWRPHPSPVFVWNGEHERPEPAPVRYAFTPLTQAEKYDHYRWALAVGTEVCWNALDGIAVRTAIHDAGLEEEHAFHRYTWCPHPPAAVAADYRQFAELYNLVKAGQLEIAADRMCDLGCPESFAYADTWRADPEIAHLSSEWLKQEYDAGAPDFVSGIAVGHPFDDLDEPYGLEESRPHL